MSSKRTQLAVVNMSGMDIVDTKVTNVDNHDWDGRSRPDGEAPDFGFQGAKINDGDSLCVRQEINDRATKCPFRMTLAFADGTELSFGSSHKDDRATNWDRDFTDWCKGTAINRHNLQVWQTSGDSNNAFYIQTATADNSGWMGKLLAEKPDVTLNELTMPGSHDAGMWWAHTLDVKTMRSEWVKTQKLTIYDQLKAGSRYFDLRVSKETDGLKVAHYEKDNKGLGLWFGGWGPDLKSEVLAQVRQFLEEPSSEGEAVFLNFSHPGLSPTYKKDKGIESEVVEAVNESLEGHLFKSPDAIVLQSQKLSKFAGKVVATFHEDFGPASQGMLSYVGIPDQPEKDGSPVIDPSKPGLHVYDNYSNTDEYWIMEDGDETEKGQKYKLRNYSGKDYLFQLSWTLTNQAGKGKYSGTKNIQALSSGCNPRLAHVLATERAKPNIVVIDFLTAQLCTIIIRVNDR